MGAYGRWTRRFAAKFGRGESANRAAEPETQSGSAKGAYYLTACAGVVWLRAYVPIQERLKLLLGIGQLLGSPIDVRLESTHHEDKRLRQWRESLAVLTEFWGAYYDESGEIGVSQQRAEYILCKLKAQCPVAYVEALMNKFAFSGSMQARVFRSQPIEFAVVAELLDRYEPVVAGDYHAGIVLSSAKESGEYVRLTAAKIFETLSVDQDCAPLNYDPYEELLEAAGLEYIVNFELRDESRFDANLYRADGRYHDLFQSLVAALDAREEMATSARSSPEES